jgi:hypothetical protein
MNIEANKSYLRLPETINLGRIHFGGPQKSDIVIINVHDPYFFLSFRYHADMTTKGLEIALGSAKVEELHQFC